MHDHPPVEQLVQGLLPALPLGVLLALLWLTVFRRKATGREAFCVPLWQLLFFLALGVLSLALGSQTDPGPSLILAGISLAGLLLSSWVANGKPFTLTSSGKTRSRRGQGRRGRRRKSSSGSLAIHPRHLAAALPVLILAGLMTGLLIVMDSTSRIDATTVEKRALPLPTKPEPAPAPVFAEISADMTQSPELEPDLPPTEELPEEVAPQAAVSADAEPAPDGFEAEASTLVLPEKPAEDPTPEEPSEPAPSTPPEQTMTVAFAPKTVSFRRQIMPLLQQNCVDCHNAEKQKGELRLDSPDFIRKGGKTGAVIVAGVPDRSPLYTMTTLDADDPDVMPSKGDLLPVEAQQLLRTWIEEGADLEDGKPFGALAGDPAKLPGTTVTAPVVEAPAIEPKILATLQRRFVALRPLNNEHTLFEAVLRSDDPEFRRPELELLERIAANVHTLDLARTEITDADLAILAKCSNLTVLRLAGTPISDAAMEHLKHLSRLRSLNLTGTAVTNAGLAKLEGLTSLEEVFATGTKATSDGINHLRETTGAKVFGTF